MIFGNDTFLIFMENSVHFVNPNYRIDDIYLAGVSTIGVEGGHYADRVLPKNAMFEFRNQFYQTTNKETISSGAVSSLEFSPNLESALVTGVFIPDDTAETFTNASLAPYFSNGDKVLLTTTGTLPAGLLTTRYYYVVERSGDTLKLSLTLGGSAINFTGNGTGTHTISHAIIFDTQKTAFDLPNGKKNSLNFSEGQRYSEGSNEMVKSGIEGFWLEWSVSFGANTAEQVSQIKTFLNYSVDRNNRLWFVPSKDKLGNIFEVVRLASNSPRDEINFTEIEIKLKTKNRVPQLPDDYEEWIFGGGFV